MQPVLVGGEVDGRIDDTTVELVVVDSIGEAATDASSPNYNNETISCH